MKTKLNKKERERLEFLVEFTQMLKAPLTNKDEITEKNLQKANQEMRELKLKELGI